MENSEAENSYLSYSIMTVFHGIKMKNIKIITSFVSPKGLKAQANKTGINFMILF